MGIVGVEEAKDTIMGNSFFSTQIQTASSSKKGNKMKNDVLQITLFYFSVFTVENSSGS